MRQKVRMRLLRFALLCFVASVIFVVPSWSAEKTLVIGTTLPLSGPAAGWGLGLSRMNDFFAEDVNARGGLKIGDDVYKIKTIAYDNKGQPSEAAANATKLVTQDKIHYLIGGVIAATGMAELPITQPAKVVTTSLWWGKDIIGPDKPYSFRQTVSQDEIAQIGRAHV